MQRKQPNSRLAFLCFLCFSLPPPPAAAKKKTADMSAFLPPRAQPGRRRSTPACCARPCAAGPVVNQERPYAHTTKPAVHQNGDSHASRRMCHDLYVYRMLLKAITTLEFGGKRHSLGDVEVSAGLDPGAQRR